MPRIYLDEPIAAGVDIVLPAAQARHVQVLRLQPGDALTLFNGGGGEWSAAVVRMERTSVTIRSERYVDVDRELARHVTLAIGMPANERMDALIEKATELGVAAVQPLVCERSVLRLTGERASRRVEHWRGIAVAASEQSGRTRVPTIHQIQTLRHWLEAASTLELGAPASVAQSPDAESQASTGSAAATGLELSFESMAAAQGHTAQPASAHRPAPSSAAGEPSGQTSRLLLSPSAACALTLETLSPADGPLVVLSGPEGGLTSAEEEHAHKTGFRAVSLGARILRADTAPLAILAACGIQAQGLLPG